MWLLLWPMALKSHFIWLLKVAYFYNDIVYGVCHISKLWNKSYKTIFCCQILTLQILKVCCFKTACVEIIWCRLACIRNCWEYHVQSIAIQTKMSFTNLLEKRKNYHHDIGMFSKLINFLFDCTFHQIKVVQFICFFEYLPTLE